MVVLNDRYSLVSQNEEKLKTVNQILDGEPVVIVSPKQKGGGDSLNIIT